MEKIELNRGKIIYWPELSLMHKYLLFFALFSLLRRALPFIIEKYGNIELEDPNFNKSSLFDMLSNFAADFLVGLYKLYLFIRNINSKKKVETNERIESLMDIPIQTPDEFIEEKQKKREEGKIKQETEMKQNFFLIMAIISLLDIVAQLCLLVFSYFDTDGCILNFSLKCNDKRNEKPKINEDDLIFTVAINIIFRFIFARLLLTLYIYLHQKVSLVITFISFIPLIIFNINTLNSSEKSSKMILYILLNILMTILFACEDVMNKVALENLVIRPYDLMFYKSLFQIPLFAIIIVIVCLKDKNNPSKNIISYLTSIIKNGKLLTLRVIYRLTFIIFNIFRTLSLISVIEILTPVDLSILKSLEFVVLSIFSMIKDLLSKDHNNQIIFYIIEIICCIFLFLSSCLANEIFIINRLSLSEKTKFYQLHKDDPNAIPDVDKDMKDINRYIENDDIDEDQNSRKNSEALFGVEEENKK